MRTPDKPYIDIAHAQTHASLGQPIRVFTREVDGEDSVVYMDDPPPFAISAKYRGSGNAGPH